jgi:hypothetical protein
MSDRIRAALFAALFGICSLMLVAPAEARQRWTVFAVDSQGVDQAAANTFRNLLISEITRRLGADMVAPPATDCSLSAPCLQSGGRAVGAEFSVKASLGALGRKVIVNVLVVDVARGTTATSQRMTINRVEELDLVATRIATAIASGKSAQQTAQLGTITSNEVNPDRRKKPARGISFRLGTIVPFGDGYADAVGGGVAIDLSYWFETRHFAIEPRVGVRFDAVRGDEGYVEVPIDIGGFYLFSRGNISPFIGGGAGIRYIWDSRKADLSVGSTIPSRATKIVEDSAWGFGAYGRVGIMFMRMYTVRLAVSGEYNITVATVNGKKNPQSFSGGLSIIF